MRLRWQKMCKWKSERKDDTEVDAEVMSAHIQACKNAVEQRSDDIRACCETVCEDMDKIQKLMEVFRSTGKETSHLFYFWDTYIEMVQLLLQFIRAERDGCWELHLATVSRMAPCFYAMDRTNYSRWLPVYLLDMHQLPQKFPEVYEEFLKGNHAVSRSTQPYSRVWTDMTLEQSINLDSKKRGGNCWHHTKVGDLEQMVPNMPRTSCNNISHKANVCHPR